MATKFCSTQTVDALFAFLYTANGNLQTVILTSCAVVPTITNCTTGSTDYCLAVSTNNTFMSTGYFTIANDGANRKCTLSACSCDEVRNTGVASYVALIDDSSSIRYMTTCTTQSLTSGNKVNIGSWSITVNQPT